MATIRKRRPQPFEDIRVWQEARTLVKTVYEVAAGFPKLEEYGMASQLRRAVVSIAANIAEGARRETARDFAHFLNMAEGSAAEVKNYIVLAGDLGYIAPQPMAALLTLLGQLLSHLYHFRVEVEQGKG